MRRTYLDIAEIQICDPRSRRDRTPLPFLVLVIKQSHSGSPVAPVVVIVE